MTFQIVMHFDVSLSLFIFWNCHLYYIIVELLIIYAVESYMEEKKIVLNNWAYALPDKLNEFKLRSTMLSNTNNFTYPAA